MDRIEPVGGPDDRPNGAPFPAFDNNSLTPTAHTPRPRALSRSRRPSIRLSRLSSVSSLGSSGDDPNQNPQNSNRRTAADDSATAFLTRNRSPGPGREHTQIEEEDESWQGSRRRSSSEPRPGRWSSPSPVALSRIATPMLPLAEVRTNQSRGPRSPSERQDNNLESNPENPQNDNHEDSEKLAVRPPPVVRPRADSRLRRTSQAALNRFSRNRASTVNGPVPKVIDWNHYRDEDYDRSHEYDPDIVNVLDVIDPEVSALSTLTNVQNSLFVPDLFGFVNREPTYTLSPPHHEAVTEEEGTTTDDAGDNLQELRPDMKNLRHLSSISSVLDAGETRFAVLPDETNLDGWTKEDIEELNDHVRHMLHSRRNKFKRAMKGFGQYVSKPLGFLVTLYATLITLFGLAWVLFLIGWINVGGKQLYVINIIDNILVSLFAIMGDGLVPFRAIDTYHMIFIARYTFLTWKIRKQRALPSLKNKNDLPVRREIDIDVEWGDTPKDEAYEFSVLDRIQQARLIHHQKKFAKSHTFYKPHETVTHYAFPLRLLIAIVVVLDCHSMLQIALGTCTWSIDYHVRPFALTTVILCCSIACNISGGVMIMIGDRMTRKKDVVERMFRQKLTSEAMKIMQKRRRKEEKRNASLSHTSSGPSNSVLAPQVSPYEGT